MAEPPAREFAICPDHYEALSRHSKKRSTESILQTTVLPQAGTANGKVDRKGVIFTVIAIAFGIFLGSKGVPLGDAMRAVRSDH